MLAPRKNAGERRLPESNRWKVPVEVAESRAREREARVPVEAGGLIRCLAIVSAIAALLICVTPSRAQPWPTSRAARAWRPPAGFIREALCIHRFESVDWHRRWVDYLGRRSSYAGGLQFLESTWRTAGGRGEPWQWSPREQVYRAFVTVSRDGSWREWGTRARCGL